MFALLAVLSVAILLSDFSLMYFVFRDSLILVEKKNLSVGCLAWGVLSLIGLYFVFAHFGISAQLYKFILMIGWLPWLVIFIVTLPRKLALHVFVCGITRIWSLVIHSLTAIIITVIFEGENEIIFSHTMLYLLIFIVCLPLSKRYLAKLLPPDSFFNDYGQMIAFFPIMIALSVILLWSQEPLIHSWQERLSRLYLPFVFFFFYRHILLTTKQSQEQKRTELNFRRMREQLTVLKEYNRLMQQGREKVAVMRHDLRHSYRLISVMLQKNELDAAKDYVDKQEILLGRTKIKNFCDNLLVNAALSFYISRAENLGIKVRTKINLPEKFSTDESDLALLLSNLLENAINACSNQKSADKIISVTIQSVESQCILEIFNSCGSDVLFDEKNYPQSSAEGHGFGIASVKLFSQKYHAYTDFILEGEVFKVTIYWKI